VAVVTGRTSQSDRRQGRSESVPEMPAAYVTAEAVTHKHSSLSRSSPLSVIPNPFASSRTV